MIKYVNKEYTWGDTVYIINDKAQIPYTLIGVTLEPSFRADEAVPKFRLFNVNEGTIELYDFQVSKIRGEVTDPPPQAEDE